MIEIAIGVDIGGTNTKLGLVTSEGVVLHKSRFLTESHLGFSHFKKILSSEIEKLLKIEKLSFNSIKGIGFGCPNGNGKTGRVEKLTNLKWDDIDFVNEMKEIFPVPIYLDNDANVAALGEALFGEGQLAENFIVVTLGTGVGTGTIIDRKLYSASSGLASEGGHIPIEYNGRQCGCGQKGHLEVYANISGIEKTALELHGLNLSFHEIHKLYGENDPKIKEVVSYTAEKLALGLTSMAGIIAPDLIILSGGISSLGESFIKEVESFFNELIYPPLKGVTKIVVSKIATTDGAILGASALVF